ncbi:MAG: hypothetical protein E6Q58_04525, partial [Niabella sp.]
MDELIAKYLLAEGSEEENFQVEQWLKESQQNQKYFDQIQYIWNQSKQAEGRQIIDTNTAWEKFETRIGQTKENKTAGVKALGLFSKIAIAASLLVAISITAYFLLRFDSNEITSANHTMVKDLPDHSIVTLNKNSTIYVDKNFNKKDRKITLKGEAFFNVAANKNKPFVITTQQASVTVIGTTFNIKAQKHFFELIVESGIVKVSSNNKTVLVYPKQKILINEENSNLQIRSNEDLLYQYFITNEFNCNNTPLEELTDALSKN